MRLFFVSLSVCGTVPEIDEFWWQISHTGVVIRDKMWQLNRVGLAVHMLPSGLVNFGQGALVPQKVKVVKKFVTLFSYVVANQLPLPRLSKRAVLGLPCKECYIRTRPLPFTCRPTAMKFSGAQIFDSGYLGHFLS